jgi:hypothetical protein
MTGIKQTRTANYLSVLKAIGNSLAGMNTYLFFLFIFIYHVLVIFQGIDFNDEGFHLNFYQQIFNDPESVQYAFWSWLTGIVGGTYMKLFPFLGIWGIRLLGAIVSTCTIVLAYNLLKKYLHTGYLRVSMIMLSLFINEDAKNLYYNNLSAFLYFVTAYFLFIGLRDNKKLMIFAGGFFVCLNIFSRIPNVLGTAMVLAVFYYGHITKSTIKEVIIRVGFFFGGFVFSAIVVLVLMKAMGHLTFFIDSLKMIFSSSQGATQDDGLEGAYGITRLLKNNLTGYANSLKFIFIIGVLILIPGFIDHAVRNSTRTIKTVARLFTYIIVLGAFALIFTGWFTSYRLIEFFTGISLLSAFVLFQKKITPDFKLLTFIGGLILLIHPFGSSEGISTVVVYSMWLSFPIAMDYIARLNWVNLDVKIDSSAGKSTLKSVFSSPAFRKVRLFLICLFSLACLYNVVMYPYLCDRHSRWDMRYCVNNKYMKGVFTSKGRAEALNQLLEASANYIKPNDYVLAYDCMPMYHYMTETRSYVRNPCIWFYTTGLFRRELTEAESNKTRLPIIVRQLIKTTGDGSAWPEVTPVEDYSLFKRTQGKNNILNDFVKRHKYIEAWNNGAFTILVPQNQ